MKLWTIQTIEVYDKVVNDNYKVNKKRSYWYSVWKEPYEWLENILKNKCINNSNEGMVWGWYKYYGSHRKPDIRTIRKTYDNNKNYVCLTIEIPEEDVLLFDSDGWHSRCSNDYNFDFNESYEQWERNFDRLSIEEQRELIVKSWDRMFDTSESISVQAVFWGLKKKYIKGVQYFQGTNTFNQI